MTQTCHPTKYGTRCSGEPYAPEQILKLVKRGSVLERPCKAANCGCMGNQRPCIMSLPVVVVVPA